MPATPLTALDEAWAAWVDGRADDAIRGALAILEADPSQDPAAALLATALAAEDDAHRGAASSLVDVFIDRGDLPRAVALAKVAGDGLDRVAEAFGEGSARVADVPVQPPPLPPKSVERPTEAGAALRARAAQRLAERPAAAGERRVARYPLFGDLAPPALEALLEAFEVRALPAGAVVVGEGDEGAEAFVVVRGHLDASRGQGEGATVLAHLGPGAIFGEMALVSGAPRAASVTANEPVQLLVGAVDALEAAAKASPVIGAQLSAFCRARMVSNLVRHSQILGAVEPAERDSLVGRFSPVTFEAGDALVTREQESDGLFLIASGRVRVTHPDEDGDELVVAELGPGDVVGEIGLVLRRPATADVVATHHTVALRLTRDEFQDAIKEHPGLLGELYDLATKRDEETQTVVAQEALDVEDVILL